jgi:hypothetical protein
VTLPLVVNKHPFSACSTQLCASVIYLINQTFTAI